MIKIYQSRTGKNGNCFNACLASILEIDIKTIPKLSAAKERWVKDFQEWLKPFNIGINWVEATGSNTKFYGYAIGAFEVKGKNYSHAVVCKNGRKVHDPFPNKDECRKLGKLLHWYVITVLDISVPIKIKE